MNFELLKNTFQFLIYIGTFVSIYGGVLISLNPSDKVKWAFNIPTGILVTTIGAVLLLVGTIFFNICSSKLESDYKADFERKLADRDEIIRKNDERLLNLNQFYAEIDNPVKSMYFILDLGSTILNDNFDDFSCVIRFDLLDITAQFKTLRNENHPLSENTVNLETRIVKGKNLEVSPFVAMSIGSFKNMSEFYLNIMFIKNYLPKDFSLRDLNELRFYFFLSEKQTSIVKGIKLNVNNWDIFNRRENKIHWRELNLDWLPNRKDLKVFHQEYQTRFYDYNTIQFFKEGFSYYEVVQSNMDTRSQIKSSDINLSLLNDTSATFGVYIDNKWLVKNNALIEYLPLISKNGVSIRIFRDTDNILKVTLSYKYSKNVILKCKYPENYIDSRENYLLFVTWDKSKTVFYIDGQEVNQMIIK
ncbi:MAG: hypothetical protein HQ541_07840 [Mariniphaga sp.]|nr:hypothetical protein [Mariniphaga sp.]